MKNQPTRHLKKVYSAIIEAKKYGAVNYSLEQLALAQNHYDSALVLLQQENDKIFFLRNYDSVNMHAQNALMHAGQAAKMAKKNSHIDQITLRLAIDTLKAYIDRHEPVWQLIPMENTQVIKYEKGLLHYAEAKRTFNGSDFIATGEKLKLASDMIKSATDALLEKLSTYFISFPEWEKMAVSAIRDSRNGNSILIDKIASRCYLYQKGKLIASFDAEFGMNWMGDKQFQGDKATPEGRYSVIRKKSGSATKYHKALLLDYPNKEDQKRYSQAIKKGTIPKQKSIGNLIEIHGDGGKGIHWTDGCVALSNKDMDRLYNEVQVSTSVTIVGSLIDLPDLMSSIQKSSF